VYRLDLYLFYLLAVYSANHKHKEAYRVLHLKNSSELFELDVRNYGETLGLGLLNYSEILGIGA